MPARFTITVHHKFSAAHSLRDYVRACNMLHGHNFLIAAQIGAEHLNELGMVMDFCAAEEILAEICEELDHKYLNELPAFTNCNPTAENIAQWIYQKLAAKINGADLRLTSLTLWETDNYSVTYTEE